MKKTNSEIEKDIVKLYKNGASNFVLSGKFNVNRATIQRILIRNNILLRKKTPLLKYNVNFFKNFNENNCYWAGFIAADGCIRSERNALEIKLKSTDSNHLEKFLKEIESEYKVKYYKDYSAISINGEWFVNDLKSNFRIIPRKSLRLKFPRHIPSEFVSHFIRGYFDGDGSISGHPGKTIQINFVGTYNILNTFRKYFKYILNIKLNSGNDVPPLQNIGNVYSLAYSGKNAKKILDLLYMNCKSNFLERKFYKYQTLKKKYEIY